MLDHLEDNIRRVIADVRPQMLEKVIENWTSRLDYIRASRGSHMPEIIFKIKTVKIIAYLKSKSNKNFDNRTALRRTVEEASFGVPSSIILALEMRQFLAPGWFSEVEDEKQSQSRSIE
ncbi:hypothetical protein TNCV_1472881 [Trichonephila clavipes]|nr:hypothetical protein TNCV_1472881 [Trichonephila clavipes]